MVPKRYVNPHNSILDFVKQYRKIQDKIFIKEEGNNYRTHTLSVKTWSTYPIEKQALSFYTRDMYYRFPHEFERIEMYNVHSQRGNLYLLVPNSLWCPFYGSRSYYIFVNPQLSEYGCEFCKFT